MLIRMLRSASPLLRVKTCRSARSTLTGAFKRVSGAAVTAPKSRNKGNILSSRRDGLCGSRYVNSTFAGPCGLYIVDDMYYNRKERRILGSFSKSWIVQGSVDAFLSTCQRQTLHKMWTRNLDSIQSPPPHASRLNSSYRST